MVLISPQLRVHLILHPSILRLTLILILILFQMPSKLFSVSLGPIVDGKPSKFEVVVAESFEDVVAAYEGFPSKSELLSIQLLPDLPKVL